MSAIPVDRVAPLQGSGEEHYRAVGRSMVDAMGDKRDAHLNHMAHVFGCDICTEETAKLRKKLKKWKKRAKKAEAPWYASEPR